MSSPINQQRDFEAKQEVKQERGQQPPEQRLPPLPLARTPPTSLTSMPFTPYNLHPLPQHPAPTSNRCVDGLNIFVLQTKYFFTKRKIFLLVNFKLILDSTLRID